VLGPQGAATTRRESDPERVSSYQPDAAPVFNWLMALASCAMGLAAAWLLFRPDVGLLSKWVLAVGAVFFLYGAVLLAMRANRRQPVGLDAAGLWVDGPAKRKLIRWSNVDQLSVISVASQKFNVVTLKDPSELIAQYDQQEARSAVFQENTIGVLAGAIGIVFGGAVTSPDLAGTFARRRKQYGGEILITQYDRDRGAVEFQVLLEAWLKKYATGVRP
jgi:hypothetical protein